MESKYFSSFNKKRQQSALNVLTITGAFPNLVQPWLVNQLVQVQRQGGDNRIISFREESISNSPAGLYGLERKYCCVGNDRPSLLSFFANNVVRFNWLRSGITLCKNYVGIGKGLKIKRLLFEIMFSPAFAVKPDLVHSHEEIAGAKLNNLIKTLNVPHVVTFHGLPPADVAALSVEERQSFTESVDLAFVNTNFAKRHYVALGGPAKKVRVVPQGIDLTHWHYQPNRPPKLHEPLRLLTVGRLSEEKGHRYVISALPSLIKNGIDVQYHIVGQGPEKEPLQKQAAELGLQGNVFFHGVLKGETLRQHYVQSHLFVLPSIKGAGKAEETQGVVIQEAQASGLIVVAANTGGIPECLDDGVSGFLVPDKDPEALSQMVRHLLKQQGDWPLIQEKARLWVETHYCSDKIGKRMNHYYWEAIQNYSEASTKELVEANNI